MAADCKCCVCEALPVRAAIALSARASCARDILSFLRRRNKNINEQADM